MIFLYLSLAFILVRLPWLFTIPMQEAPDEFAHYWVIKFIKEHMQLPSAFEVAAGGASAVYGSLPPFGYVPHVLIAFLFPEQMISFSARLGSLFMGLVMLYAAYQTSFLLFPSNKLLRLALPSLIIVHPQLVFVHSYANNDSTSSALSSLIVLLMLKIIRLGITYQRSLVLGIFTGWLALSKYSALIILPMAGISLCTAIALHKATLARVFTNIMLWIASASCVCLWWFARNYLEFAGDLLGTQTMYKTWATTFHRELIFYISPLKIVKELRWWRMMFFSFWGMFGYMNIYLWRPLYFVYLGFTIAAVVGWLKDLRKLHFAIAASNGWLKDLRNTQVIRLDLINCITWTTLVAILILNLAAMLWGSATNLGGPQGRYLFTSEIPVLALLLAGLARLGQNFSRITVIAFIGFNTLVCIGSWLMLFKKYGFHLQPL